MLQGAHELSSKLSTACQFTVVAEDMEDEIRLPHGTSDLLGAQSSLILLPELCLKFFYMYVVCMCNIDFGDVRS